MSDMTVGKMKIRDTLIFGAYTINDKTNEPTPIAWGKASKDGLFVSCKILDRLCMDSSEEIQQDSTRRNCGNNDYTLSNLNTYLNSNERDWFVKTHPLDEAPNYPWRGFHGNRNYGRSPGFLYYFEPGEIELLEPQEVIVKDSVVYERVRVLRASEVFGDDRLSYFRKGGIRAVPTKELSLAKYGCELKKFIPYWIIRNDLQDVYKDNPGLVNSSCLCSTSVPFAENGLRPVIKLSPETKVRQIDERTYTCVLEEIKDEEDIMSFLGLA